MTIWYVARGAGLAAVLLLSITTALGVLSAGRATPSRRLLVQYAHRATAGLGLAALVLHITTILADSYAHVGWLGALVPLTSSYRPTAVALGTLAAYGLVAVAVLGLARGRMAATARGARTWRGLHAAGYGVWGFAMVHGLLSGSDTSVGWVQLLYVGCAAGVAGAVAVRLAPARTPAPRPIAMAAAR